MERTVKGHTKGVMDVDFDQRGGLMGELFASVSRVEKIKRGKERS
jgi:hypothetical protein